MEPGQVRSLPIRFGNFDQLPIHQSDNILDRRDRSKLNMGDSYTTPASTDRIVQSPTQPKPKAAELPTMLRVPTEIRAKIFKYLLPDKSQNIEPTEILYARWELDKENVDRMLARVLGRARHQHRATNELLGFSQFHGPFDPKVHNARFRIPHSNSIGSFAIPLDNFSVEAFGDVYDMPATNGSSSFGDGIRWSSSPTMASTPPSEKTWPSMDLEAMSSLRSNPFSSSSEPQPNIFIDLPTPKALSQIKEALQEEHWDAIPTNTTLSLMATHSLFATEIATILYEEYTFDIRVHDDGVEFLHLPRIATYEYYGDELVRQTAQFQEHGHFCLQRMRHLSFVLVGGDMDSRTAAWRMRKNVQDLVEMVGDLATLDVRFSGDDDFWMVPGEGLEGPRARMGMKDVSVAEMVCAPFVAGLSGVGKAELELPEGLKEVEGLMEWKGWFEARVMGRERVEKDDGVELREMAMFEAAREWEYRQDILGGGESFAWLEEMDVDMGDEWAEDEEMGYDNDTI